MKAIILAGGLGTRLRSVCADRPKPMADLNGRPFLSVLMEYWKRQGVSHFILSVGYLHQIVIDVFGSSFEGIPIDYAIEPSPLGTGGGLLLALKHLEPLDDPVLVLNGDTYFEVSLAELKKFHEEKTASCTLSLLAIDKNTRYGGLSLLPSGQIQSFQEQGDQGQSLINGGCYLISASFLRQLHPQPILHPLSLEKEILVPAVSSQKAYGKVFDAYFLDIGIPEDYFRAVKKFQPLTAISASKST
jgi:D-glycero-alpha-D-manno-heptose 1-phosphate guanylyltransferase